jgi:hypothetical protein
MAAVVEDRLEDRLAFYAKPKLLIVDELGYLPFGSNAAHRATMLPLVTPRAALPPPRIGANGEQALLMNEGIQGAGSEAFRTLEEVHGDSSHHRPVASDSGIPAATPWLLCRSLAQSSLYIS